ncbi:MAG: hypothetical protein P4M09_15660 [Devosia sp.]|nr:hypothetical protein [Devosia sp.]
MQFDDEISGRGAATGRVAETSRGWPAGERRDASSLAAEFAAAAATGDVAGLLRLVDDLDLCAGAWEQAMRRIGQLASVADDIRAAFAEIWLLHRTLPLEVGNRAVLARALTVLLPAAAPAGPARVFRGTSPEELHDRSFGFSWVTDVEVARGQAAALQRSGGAGIVLEAIAPAEAMLFVYAGGAAGEAEIVVDPFRLGPVKATES